MAIEFLSTSISQATAALAAAAAQTNMRDELVGHASGAWTLVEEFDSSGSTVHWVVLKNTGSVSPATGIDFYVCIGRVAATGAIGIFVGESYNSTTHTLSVFAPLSSSSAASNVILADFSYGGSSTTTAATFTLGTSLPTANGAPLAPASTSTATMRFVSIVERDYAIFLSNDKTWYVGALTDLIVPISGLVAAIPIACVDVFATSAPNVGALTRHPIAAADAPMQVAYSFALDQIASESRSGKYTFQSQALNTAIYGYPDRFQNNRVAAAEFAAIMYGAVTTGGANNTAAKLGLLRGKFKNIRVTTYPFAAVIYDTIVVDGRKHIILKDGGTISGSNFVTPNNGTSTTRWGYVFDTGVAA